MTDTPPQTRIQEKNRRAILEAALEVFSTRGYGGATLNRIAQEAGLSKPNLLYYFPSKEAIYRELLTSMLSNWVNPLEDLDPDGDPVDEIVAYVLRKLEMSRSMPRQSRLFANEIVQGAPHVLDELEGALRQQVSEKCEIIRGWVSAGKLAPVDPHHLIFSIWATTQHYADFDIQVRAVLEPEGDSHFDTAAQFLETLYRRTLTPR